MKFEEMKIGQKVLVYVRAGEIAETGSAWDAGERHWQDAHWHETEVESISKDPKDPYAVVKDGWQDGSYYVSEIDPDDCLLSLDGTIVYVEQD